MEIEAVEVSTYTVPLDEPESDGTLTWDSTTVVVTEVLAGDARGLGFTYGPRACATLIEDVVGEAVVGRDPTDVAGAWEAMVRSIRNSGRPGVASMAIAAVDLALWDMTARLQDMPLVRLLGMVREDVPIYASGGFTSLSDDQLAEQLSSWVHGLGIPRVKMKIATAWGTEPERDLHRVALARRVIGPECELFVDANGGYTVGQSIELGSPLEELGVSWFEEPVSSDDLEGLRSIREAIGIEVAAGEYGYDIRYFRRMCEANAVDVLQVDVSRCAGITEWLRVTKLAEEHGLEVSTHTAQSLHLSAACCVPSLRHMEYFHDHARVDRILFDGVIEPVGGKLRPDLGKPGLGLELKRIDAERYAV
jgi:L-alanine-DL-glutamate epimerase-like enolase superfamily enzyme